MSRNHVKWTGGLVRALSIEERIALLGGAAPIGARRAARARKAIERWKSRKPFLRGDAFARRLQQIAIDESSLVRALGMSAARDVRGYVRGHRVWKTFERLLDRRGGGEPHAAWQGHRALLHLVAPLLDDVLGAVDDELSALASGAGAFLDSAALRRCAFDDVSAVALSVIEKACLLELNIARLRGLDGRDSRTRYASFVRTLRSRGGARRFFREYPVLLDLLATRLDGWRRHVQAFMRAWGQDRALLVASLLDSAEPGRLVGWSSALGDSHRGGRSVTTLLFEDGRKIVYKPRPLDAEAGFNRLVAWCNRQAPDAPLRTARVLARGAYGWCEFIERDALASRADASRFYFRQGKFLALFYALHASDMHCDNVIASGDDPVYIDLETLFHALPEHGRRDARAPVVPISIAHTLMLSPARVLGEPRAEHDHCVLALAVMQGASTPGWRVVDAGTDKAALARADLPLGVRAHLPHFDGEDVALDGYLADMRRGFVRMYDLLLREKDRVLELIPELFRDAAVRQVLRPTALYAGLVRASLHPDHLRDAVERRASFERLFEATPGSAWTNRLLASEIRDLEALDVPYFSRRFDEVRIHDSRGDALADVEFASPREIVCSHLAGLCAADRQAQLELMDYSLSKPQRRAADVGRSPPGGSSPPFGVEAARAHAMSIADTLAERVIVRGDAHYWMCQSAAAESDATTMSPALSALYSGQLGIALFLGSAGALGGNGRHVALARAALRTVGAWTDGGTTNLPELGVFTGVLGYPYAMASLACQLEDRALLRESVAWFDTFEPHRFTDDIDVLGGSAGGILFLHGLMLAAARAGERVDRLRECIGVFADDIVAARRPQAVGVGWWQAQQREGPPLAGFAHGNAGIAAALYVAARVLGRGICRDVAREAIRYENAHYGHAAENWRDLREAHAGDAERDHAMMSTWCHGATGILLGRAWCLAAAPADDPLRAELRADLLRARRTSLRTPQSNDSLCHGSWGNHDVHAVAGALLADADLSAATPLDASARVREAGWGLRCGDADRTYCDARFAPPDLMSGMAGVGYGLLRHAAQQRVPSVLGLAVLP
jgi:type 2 lantibiotic biosynthesis protein LanM